MHQDMIVQEVRARREEVFAKHGHDLAKLLASLERRGKRLTKPKDKKKSKKKLATK